MVDFEKLIQTIMKEAEADGEPVTYEEAKEMAEMEVKAKKEVKNVAQSGKKRKLSTKERKVDEEKGVILRDIKALLEGLGATNTEMKTETAVSFSFNGSEYSVKLTKHRPKKA